MTTKAVKEDLNLWQEKIDQVKDYEGIQLGMPRKTYLQACMSSVKQFEGNREALAQGGMDFAVVSSIPSLANATRGLLSDQSMVTFPNIASKRAWEKGKEQAEELLHDIKAAMEYGFRKYPELLARITEINEGSSNPDLIQDLSDAAALASANSSLLIEAKYDMANVERASVLAKELADLLAQATYDRSTTPENCIVRDKAYTLLKTIMDELIKQAKYIFRADKEKAAKFVISAPHRKQTRKAEPVTEPAPVAAAA
jgi:hypothetical protein